MTERARRARGACLYALALALVLAAGCRSGRRLDPLAVVSPHLDAEQEREIGYQFDQELQKQVHVIDDPVVAGFLNDLGREIVAGTGQQPFVYRFRVLPDQSLNAFAVPGGYVYFHSGTLLEAGSVDELAGVMGHEIAHVRLRHFARMQEQGQLPKLLSTLAGVAGAVVTGEPAVLMASQGINVALELRWSREFESEADREGIRLMAAAGLRPDAMAHFFERIVAEERSDPQHIPPYLYSHPDVEKRIDTVEIMARRVEVAKRSSEELRAGFKAAQDRLAQVLASHGKPVITAQPGDAGTDALLAAAETAASVEDRETALAKLHEAAERAPSDPRVFFRIGELEAGAGRYAEAAHALRRTLELDPTRALVFYRLGEVTRAQGDAQFAVYAFEQAARRAGPAGALRARAEWQVVTLTFPLVLESGLRRAPAPGGRDAGLAVEHFTAGERTLTWWGRLGPRYEERANELRARWLPPGADNAEDAPVKLEAVDLAVSTLELPEPGAVAGDWRLEILLDGDVLLRRSVQVETSAAQPGR